MSMVFKQFHKIFRVVLGAFLAISGDIERVFEDFLKLP